MMVRMYYLPKRNIKWKSHISPFFYLWLVYLCNSASRKWMTMFPFTYEWITWSGWITFDITIPGHLRIADKQFQGCINFYHLCLWSLNTTLIWWIIPEDKKMTVLIFHPDFIEDNKNTTLPHRYRVLYNHIILKFKNKRGW